MVQKIPWNDNASSLVCPTNGSTIWMSQLGNGHMSMVDGTGHVGGTAYSVGKCRCDQIAMRRSEV
ncbi:hypothetical protein N7490_011490 [Penicillium lividum]|nr:hypothetical protein N7490_011490 [Penicillium lividum]